MLLFSRSGENKSVNFTFREPCVSVVSSAAAFLYHPSYSGNVISGGSGGIFHTKMDILNKPALEDFWRIVDETDRDPPGS